ncbi:hypothetical protein E1297_04175, partial [Roseibium sp. RKSG952]|nr:hypothetical protein [Roseibium sp. RKSG952]
GFSGGGYTGDGGKYEPAGVVHRGEYVFSKQATKRIGVGNLEDLHRRGKGYANGGFVGPSAVPSIAAPKALSAPPPVPRSGDSIIYSPTSYIDARGSQMTEDQFRAILEENNRKNVPVIARQTVGKANKHSTNPAFRKGR